MAMAIGGDEVDVWKIELDGGPQEWPLLMNRLSQDEQARAGRFRFRTDQRRFVIARSALREILGRYLDVPRERIKLKYGSYGKPALFRSAGPRLEFNASRSQEVGLIAVSVARPLGIDVEHVSNDIEWRPLAEKFFSARETATLGTLPESMQSEAFFACWTRKEAYLKARGDGLSTPLSSFSVGFAPAEPAAILQAHPAEARMWTLEAFCPAPGFLAALVVEGSGWKIVQKKLRWSTEDGRFELGVLN